MDTLTYLHNTPTAFILIAGIFGLLVGSFLNVVIHRLPIMMEREWRQQCHEFLEMDAKSSHEGKFNLIVPRSRCPNCGHLITTLENIPLFSYLFLKRKCSGCDKPIPLRYPVIELTAGILSALVAWHFGFTWQAAGGLLLTYCLIPLTVIDLDHFLLPDSIVLPLLWAGLIVALGGLFVDTHTSIIGAIAGYLSLWSIYWVFKLLTGKEGMGYGDFKLLAALGAWLGWQMLPVIILLSSLVGAIVGITLIVARGHDKNKPIPFGPYLAAAGWISLIWGEQLVGLYLG